MRPKTTNNSMCAQLTWDEKGLPHSVRFDDKYFCQENGYREAIHVFCGGNHLDGRFEKMRGREEKTFVIGETGFGTGLNFLSAWQLFDQSAPANTKLQFVSLDQFPLNPDDLKKALQLWPELETYSQQLTAQYPQITVDQPRISFQDGRVALTLMVDPVLTALERIRSERFQMDAWFLDGFDPAKNPEMWTPEVFQAIALLSDAGTTVATFTSAGFVRRGLMEAGFGMERAKGFGRKRHMLKGVFQPKEPALF